MLTRLVVLGFLMKRAMSGYEIQGIMQLSQSEQWAGVLPGSIYHALKKLAGEGLVTLQATEHTGNRARAIYAITPMGVEEFRHLLRDAWRTPVLHFPTGIYTALTFLEDLPREEVISTIHQQIEQLEQELAKWNAGEQAKSPYMPAYVHMLFVNGREHMESDLRMLHYLLETLPALPSAPLQDPSLQGEENT
jgi:DNA-binding PadR family transcriptional regulator